MSPKEQAITDNILLSAQSGDQTAVDAIISQYRPRVEVISMKYINSPLEKDDLVQEGMIGLIAAIKSFKTDKGASFSTFASICIENSIQSALRKFSRKKDVPTSNTVPYEEKYLKELGTISSAEDSFLAQESVSMLTEVIYEELSQFENEVLRLHIVGCSYSEIAKKLDKTPKAIDNALQRIRKKLNKFLIG